MSTPKLLIASLSNRGVDINCILQNRIPIRNDLDLLLMSESITEYEIFDDLCDARTKVYKSTNGIKTIYNKNHRFLDKVVYMPTLLFPGYNNDDHDDTKSGFKAYLNYAFNILKSVENKYTDVECHEVLSLSRYYPGLNHLESLDKREKIIYSHIHDFLNFSTEKNSASNKQAFCFELSERDVVFVFIIAEDVLLSNLKNASKMEFMDLITRIDEVINIFIGEILLFAENKIIDCYNMKIQSSSSEQCKPFLEINRLVI